MVITSLSGVDNQYSDKFSFGVQVPEAYTISVEYTSDEVETLGDDGMYLEANSILWRMYNYKTANTGKAQVIVIVDGQPEFSYSLSKGTFEINQEVLWSKSRLQHEDIKRVISNIQENNWVKTKDSDVTLPKKSNQNEFSNEMFTYFSTDENIVGEVIECTNCKSYASLFENYKVAWQYTQKLGIEGGMLKPILNTVYIAVMEIILNIIICSAMAYSLSKLLPRFLKQKVLLIVMSSGMVSSVVTLIPLYQMLSNMGMTNSYWGLILPGLTSYGAVLLYKGCFDKYPNGILEAAEMDGAGELYKYFKFVLPAAEGVIGVQILTIFAGAWNDFFMPSLLIRDESKYTVALVMNYLLNVRSAPFNITLALGFLISIPTLLIYAFFQKYLNHGVDYSGIKG